MLRERIKEIVDFATLESPYRSANKGWVNDDVYIQWGASRAQSSNEGEELANVSVYWSPLNQVAAIIFVVLLVATTFVFSVVSFTHGRLHFPQVLDAQLLDAAPVEREIVSSKIEVNSAPTVTEKAAPVEREIVSSEIEVNSAPTVTEKAAPVEREIVSSEIQSQRTISMSVPSKNTKKAVTAVDLFQSKHL